MTNVATDHDRHRAQEEEQLRYGGGQLNSAKQQETLLRVCDLIMKSMRFAIADGQYRMDNSALPFWIVC